MQCFSSVRFGNSILTERVNAGDSCSQHKGRVGQVDKPGSKVVMFCLGNVTVAREGEHIREGGGEIPSYTQQVGPAK